MLPELNNPLQMLTWLSTFGLVLALWSVAVLLWRQRRDERRARIAARLEEGREHPEGARRLSLWHEGEEASTVVPGLPAALGLHARLKRVAADAGWTGPAETVLFTLLLIAVGVGLALAFLTARSAPGVVGFATVLTVFWWVTHRRILARDSLFERQLVDALELSSRALRAGHPLSSAFQILAQEIPAPVGTVFAGILQSQAMGMGLEQALDGAARRTKSADMKLFSAALSIHLRAGGNLADVMETLAGVIRERMRLNRRFRSLVAQTEFSKRILIVLPFLLFGILSAISPRYTSVLYDTTAGLLMLSAAGMGVLLGWLVMSRMSVLRV